MRPSELAAAIAEAQQKYPGIQFDSKICPGCDRYTPIATKPEAGTDEAAICIHCGAISVIETLPALARTPQGLRAASDAEIDRVKRIMGNQFSLVERRQADYRIALVGFPRLRYAGSN